jgi:hypothetical protein
MHTSAQASARPLPQPKRPPPKLLAHHTMIGLVDSDSGDESNFETLHSVPIDQDDGL